MQNRSVTDALKTDLYQLTMAAGYWRAGLMAPATYELFVRRLPDSRAFLVAAGLDSALDYLERLAFDAEDRAWLRALPAFSRVPAEFFDEYLPQFAFTGDAWAVPEGTIVFPGEPLLRVTAPQPEAQIVETALLAAIAFPTSVATKAARILHAADGRPLIDFGARRAHSLESAMAAARGAYIAGFEGTSLVDAARRFGVPTSGTMAHAWVQTFASELDAFREFDRTFADVAVYLLDTYDTVAAARAVVDAGLRPPMVRLDSGDLDALSRDVRRILDEGGLTSTRIFATGDLDEYRIADLVAARAPIDGFGVGTALTTVSDAPALSAVYKLVEVERNGRHAGVIKLSQDKHTWPGPKQVWRRIENGVMRGDVIAAADEAPPPDAEPLLRQVMSRGRRVARQPLDEIRAHCRSQLALLPGGLEALTGAPAYRVDVSETLERRRRALIHS